MKKRETPHQWQQVITTQKKSSLEKFNKETVGSPVTEKGHNNKSRSQISGTKNNSPRYYPEKTMGNKEYIHRSTLVI